MIKVHLEVRLIYYVMFQISKFPGQSLLKLSCSQKDKQANAQKKQTGVGLLYKCDGESQP